MLRVVSVQLSSGNCCQMIKGDCLRTINRVWPKKTGGFLLWRWVGDVLGLYDVGYTKLGTERRKMGKPNKEIPRLWVLEMIVKRVQ